MTGVLFQAFIKVIALRHSTSAKQPLPNRKDCIETLDIGETATAKSKAHNFILFVNDNPGYDFFF
ncbi:hypothetical protein HanOQP8_Chr16g0625301 [Helianthus annuus]|nr:hypothetical protein HanLR1_Chr16g0629941 [Helianthus annuus]KAJ0645562.1 hypothetical protein HanOQP8_Chr16g0625301 [Helianthus annuus]